MDFSKGHPWKGNEANSNAPIVISNVFYRLLLTFDAPCEIKYNVGDHLTTYYKRVFGDFLDHLSTPKPYIIVKWTLVGS